MTHKLGRHIDGEKYTRIRTSVSWRAITSSTHATTTASQMNRKANPMTPIPKRRITPRQKNCFRRATNTQYSASVMTWQMGRNTNDPTPTNRWKESANKERHEQPQLAHGAICTYSNVECQTRITTPRLTTSYNKMAKEPIGIQSRFPAYRNYQPPRTKEVKHTITTAQAIWLKERAYRWIFRKYRQSNILTLGGIGESSILTTESIWGQLLLATRNGGCPKNALISPIFTQNDHKWPESATS